MVFLRFFVTTIISLVWIQKEEHYRSTVRGMNLPYLKPETKKRKVQPGDKWKGNVSVRWAATLCQNSSNDSKSLWKGVGHFLSPHFVFDDCVHCSLGFRSPIGLHFSLDLVNLKVVAYHSHHFHTHWITWRLVTKGVVFGPSLPAPQSWESLGVGSRCFLMFVASPYFRLKRCKHLNRSTLVLCSGVQTPPSKPDCDKQSTGCIRVCHFHYRISIGVPPTRLPTVTVLLFLCLKYS